MKNTKLRVSHIAHGEIAVDLINQKEKIIVTYAMYNTSDAKELIKQAGGKSEEKILSFIKKHGRYRWMKQKPIKIKCANCNFIHIGNWGDPELKNHEKEEIETIGDDNWLGFVEVED